MFWSYFIIDQENQISSLQLNIDNFANIFIIDIPKHPTTVNLYWHTCL